MNRFFQVVRAVVSLILLQTLFFKFTGADESIYIFTAIGAEPVGRIASGVLELIAVILLYSPHYIWLGATLALGVIFGAILSHLTILGIVVQGDGGLLFALACIVFLGSLFCLWRERRSIPLFGKRFA